VPLLYIPKGVTAKNPAPGIVAIHGYINSRETQDGFAIEFARRGYVVLAPDQTRTRLIPIRLPSATFRRPDSLVYLRSLDSSTKNNIGLEGQLHGWMAIGDAAGAFPNDLPSRLSWKVPPTRHVGRSGWNPTFPKNFALGLLEI